MLLGEIPGHCNFGTLIVRGQRWQRIRAQNGAEAGVVPGKIAAGLRDAGVFDAAIAIDAERDRAMKRSGTANSRINRQFVPVRVNATLGGLNIPTEACGEVAATLARDADTG